MTAVRNRLATARLDIATQLPPRSGVWSHAVFCIAALPHERCLERIWQCRTGTNALRIEAGGVADPTTARGWQDLPLPFGRYPRLFLIHLCSEAMRTGRSEVSVEDTLTGFVASLRVDPNGRALRDMRTQLAPLMGANVRLWTADQKMPDGVRRMELWANTDPEKRARWVYEWPATIRLSDEFVGNLRQHAVALDRRAVTALMHSSAALDALGWVEHTLTVGMTMATPWADLWRRYGPRFRLERQFRFAFRGDLELVRGLCPHARILVGRDGVAVVPVEIKMQTPHQMSLPF